MTALVELDGAGNRFLLWDARAAAAAPDLAAARAVLAAHAGAAFGGDGVDGLLLLVAPGDPNAAARLVIVNRDGSRAEMCGNGLRCVARHLAEGLGPGVDARELVVATDVGPLACRVSRGEGGWRAAVQVGPATLGEEFTLPFPGLPRGLPAVAVEVGVPHVVVDGSHLGVRLAEAPLAAVAAAALASGRFPAGVNTDLVEVHGDHVAARVLERGVGETLACGTGACAIAAVASRRLGLGLPLRVHMPGGVLVVDQEPPGDAGALWLAGEVRVGARLALPAP